MARHFISIGPNSWGKGFTEAEAVRGMKSNVPSYIPRPYRYETFEVHPDTEVDLVSGGLVFPKGCPPISLGVTNGRPAPKSNTTQGTPAFGFRGEATRSSHRKVRVTAAEQKRIDAMVAAAKAAKRR